MSSELTNSRIKNTRRNMIAASLGQIVVAVFTFLERRVFLSQLSVAYLGINGLYTSLLSFLSIAELGVGSAIIFCLYRPIAEENHAQIATLMHLFKKVYAVIGVIVIAAGLCCLPFLDQIISSNLSSLDLKLYFIIFLANSVIGYFYSYKIYFIEANQKKYIVTSASVSFQIVQYIVQMLIIVCTRNYYLYLLVAVLVTMIKHIYLAKIADRLYPYINCKEVAPIPSDVRERIIKNTKGVFLTKVADVVVKSTDSVLITMYVSLSVTGLYSNYQMIITGLTTTMSMIFSSMTASIGNLCATEDEGKIYDSFQLLNLACFLIYGTVSVVLAVSFEPLVAVLFGSQYRLGHVTALLISLSFLFTGMRQSILMYREVLGLFWEDRFKSFFQIAINLVASIYLGQSMGIDGILIGTILSTVLTCTWIEPFIVFRKGFVRKVRCYFISYIARMLILAVGFVVSYNICIILWSQSSILNLVISIVVTISILLVEYLIVYFKNKLMLKLLGLIKKSIFMGKK